MADADYVRIMQDVFERGGGAYVAPERKMTEGAA